MRKSEKENGEDVQLMEDFLIPEYILNGEKAPPNTENTPIPSCPVLVFINGKSGGQLGNKIIPVLRRLLHPKQVLELPQEKPDEVLAQFYGHLNSLEEEEDTLATEIKNRLRLIVAGGDGTHGWLLGAVADLNLQELPPIATIPLGTGNNLPFSFGWGKKNPPTTVAAMREILEKTAEAMPMPVDRWGIVIRMSKTVEDSPLKKVTSSNWAKIRAVKNLMAMKSFQTVSTTNENFESGRHSYQGEFWNYLSIGMDSQVSYSFHALRQEHPEKFKNQFMNQSRYAELACTQGWFCASCRYPRSKNINTLANIFIANYDGNWQKLEISPRFDPVFEWESCLLSLTAPYVNDGLIEIVGLRDAWHGMALLLPHAHGTRLAQAHKVKIEFHKGGVDHTYMRVDGEPWLQNLPDDEPTVMEIMHKGQAVALTYGDCVSKPIPREVAGSVRLPIKTASFNSVLETPAGSSRGGSLKLTKKQEVEGQQFLQMEAPAAENS